MVNKNFVLMFIFAIFIFGIVSAEVTQQSLGTFKKETTINLIQNCENSTYSNISRIVYPNSSFLINTQTAMIKNGDDYSYSLNSNYTTNTGQYLVYGSCNSNGEITNWGYDFNITPNGENSNVGLSVIYIFLALVLLISIVISIYYMTNTSNGVIFIANLGFIYLVATFFTFICWNLANDFLTSSPIIISIFYWTFIVLMIGVFPMIIGFFAWLVMYLLQNKEWKDLNERGINVEDYERRKKDKYY